MTSDDHIDPRTLEEVTGYLVDGFDIPREKIVLSAILQDDLDLDSIDAVDLMVKFQETTGTKVTPEAFGGVRTVADLCLLVQSLRRSQ